MKDKILNKLNERLKLHNDFISEQEKILEVKCPLWQKKQARESIFIETYLVGEIKKVIEIVEEIE